MKDIKVSVTKTLDSTNTITYTLNHQIDRILPANDMFYLCTYAHDPLSDTRTGKVLKCTPTFEIQVEASNNGCLDATFIDECLFTVNSDCIDILDQDLKRLRSMALKNVGLCVSARERNLTVGCFDGTAWSGDGTIWRNTSVMNDDTALVNEVSTSTRNATVQASIKAPSSNDSAHRNGRTVRVSDKALWAVHMCTNTKYVYMGGDDQHLYLLDNDLTLAHKINVGNIVISICSEGSHILVGTYNNRLYRLDTRMNKIIEECMTMGSAWRIRKENGGIIMPCMYDGIVVMDNTSVGTMYVNEYDVVTHYKTDGLVYDCCIYGNALYYASFYEGKVFRYDIFGGTA